MVFIISLFIVLAAIVLIIKEGIQSPQIMLNKWSIVFLVLNILPILWALIKVYKVNNDKGAPFFVLIYCILLGINALLFLIFKLFKKPIYTSFKFCLLVLFILFIPLVFVSTLL